MEKNKLLLTPHYIGSLKYFEKLIPYLKDKYEIAFLFTPKARQNLLPEMISYCQEKNYSYYLIEKYQANKLFKIIPFYYPIRQTIDYKKQVGRLLTDKTIKKIISVFDTDFYSYHLLKTANKKEIETMVLQWSLTIPGKFKKRKPGLGRKIYFGLVNLILKPIIGTMPTGLGKLAGGSSQKFGVINQKAWQMFKELGIPKKKMAIVGYLDFALAQQSFDKQALAQKHQVNLDKKNIVIFSTPFNTKDIVLFSDSQQLDYFKKIILGIRQVFSPAEANILLKIHPAENIELYQPLKKLGVKLFGKQTNNFELTALSDLYLCHHSTTNFIPMAMNKQAIFLNLIQSPYIERTKAYNGIKKFISSQDEFKNLLADFKNNSLPLQYSPDPSIITPDSLQKILAWIN